MAQTSTTPAFATGSTKRLATGLLESVTTLWVLCAKHATRVSRKLRVENSNSCRIPPRSPLARPKQLLATISDKAIHFRQRKRRAAAAAAAAEEDDFELDADGDFGDRGLWQRTILMGDKCQPLDFSGVIYYDSNGKQLSELPPRSPRSSPLPSYVYAKREEYQIVSSSSMVTGRCPIQVTPEI